MLSSTVRQVVKFYRLTDNYLCWTVLQHRPNFFECAYTIIIGRDKGVVTQRATSGDILPINGQSFMLDGVYNLVQIFVEPIQSLLADTKVLSCTER